MNILITGNLGFVGAETEKYLLQKGYNVIGYDLMAGSDIRDLRQLETCIEKNHIDRILHLAAIARFAEADRDPARALETNVEGTINIALISKKYHIPVVYASTGSVYMPIKETPPIHEDFKTSGNSVYGCTKYLGEIYLSRIASLYIILRYSHLYGKEKRGHGLIGGFLERIERGLAPELYGGKQSNDFCYVKDIARANYLALTASWDNWNQVYNIGTGEEISAEKAGEIICDLSGYKGKIEKKEIRTVDPIRFVYDCKKAKRLLKFKAEYSFEQGLKDFLS